MVGMHIPLNTSLKFQSNALSLFGDPESNKATYLNKKPYQRERSRVSSSKEPKGFNTHLNFSQSLQFLLVLLY